MRSFYTPEQCHQILGLDPKKKYSIEEYKKAYKAKAFKYHPDRNPDDILAHEMFLKIKEAYETLTNPSFVHFQKSETSELDIVLHFNATFKDGFFGKEYVFNFNRNIDFEGNSANFTISPIKFKLPAGSQGLYTRMIKDNGIVRDTEVGNLHVQIQIASHPHFTIQGNNVVANVSVKLETLIKGGIVDVLTMYGVREIKVKPGTLPNTPVKIPNCGVNQQNYHIAILSVVFPTPDDLKKGDWPKLGINWNI